MLCSVHRWFISGSLDTGKPVPAIVRRHLTLCPSCKDFETSAHVMGNRLVEHGQTLLTHSHQGLEERIVSSLPGAIARDSKSGVTSTTTKMETFFEMSRSYLRPAMAAAVLLMVVSLGLWFYGLAVGSMLAAISRASIPQNRNTV